MKSKIIKILKENKNKYISGEKISKLLNVSRTAVWKHISSLRNEGYIIESASRKGYKLVSAPDILDIEFIKEKIYNINIAREIHYYKSIESTNDEAKNLALKEKKELVVISEEQIKGRGRLGRSWISPPYKGIWMSLVLNPDIAPQEAPKITQIAAASISQALDDMKIGHGIKWPNDIVVDNKKVCGILTEMNAEIGRVNFIVIGIGINVNTDKSDFPYEIKDIASSLKNEANRYIKREDLIINILKKFAHLYKDFLETGSIARIIEICKRKSVLLNKKVRLIGTKEEKIVKVINIDEEGRLVIENEEGNIEKIISGEISIRGLNDYI